VETGVFEGDGVGVTAAVFEGVGVFEGVTGGVRVGVTLAVGV
jgi:hypothetical protein